MTNTGLISRGSTLSQTQNKSGKRRSRKIGKPKKKSDKALERIDPDGGRVAAIGSTPAEALTEFVIQSKHNDNRLLK